MAISTQDVHAAADTLTAQGRRPTLAAIRAALGGGSFSTIGEALKSWNAPAAQSPQTPTIPEAISDGAARMAAALWAQATEQAQQGIADARQELEQQRTALEAQRQEAVEAADTLAAQLVDARSELATACKELEVLRNELATIRERLASATERTQQAEAQAVGAKEAETVARVAAAELRGRLEGMEALHHAKAQEQSRSKGKAATPIQGSLEVG